MRTLIDRTPGSGPAVLPPPLFERYDGDLCFGGAADRPYVIGNFVATLDGIVSFAVPGKAGGGEISGHDDEDRFLMGLLRASADAVMIGAGTLDATHPRHVWTPEGVYRDAKELYASYRRDALGKTEPPATVIVSGSGAIDLDRPMFRTAGLRVYILTTGKGAERLRAAGAADLPTTEVLALDVTAGAIAPATMLHALQTRCGVRLLLHEGGPTLYGEFIAAGLVDEMFVTLAPQIAGSKPERPRPTMVWGTEFAPGCAPWVKITSVKASGDYLYLRYSRRAA